MPGWMDWINRHGFAVALVALVILAIVYVIVNYKSLFYKE